MSELTEISKLIGLIYDSVETPETWVTALQAVSRFLSVKDTAIGSQNLDTHQLNGVSTPLDPDYWRSYCEYWAPRNFLWKTTATWPVGNTFSFHSAANWDEFARSALYNEFFHPQGMDQALGANILAEGPLSAVVTVYRPASSSDFSNHDVRRFRVLLPHFQRAWRLTSHLQVCAQRSSNVDAVLSAIDKPAIIVDRDANFLCGNPLAEQLLLTRSLFVVERGRLAAQASDETISLRRLIFGAATKALTGAGGKMVIRRESRTAMVVLVSPLPGARYAGSDQLAIIFVDDPERERASGFDCDVLKAQYQLTQAEAALAAQLLASADLRSAANALNIAVSTARTHLAHVFQKTGAHSQAALMRLLRRAGHDN